jgi:hypothetical protein
MENQSNNSKFCKNMAYIMIRGIPLCVWITCGMLLVMTHKESMRPREEN